MVALLAVAACTPRTLDANAEYLDENTEYVDAGEDTDLIVELYTDGSAARVTYDYVACGTYRLRNAGEEVVVTFPSVEFRFLVEDDPEWRRYGPIPQEYECGE